MKRVRRGSYGRLLLLRDRLNNDQQIKQDVVNLNELDLYNMVSNLAPENVKYEKDRLSELREKKVELYELEKLKANANPELVLRTPMFQMSFLSTEQLKKLDTLAKQADMNAREAYLDVTLNSNKTDMPQSVLENAIGQKQRERKWYQKTFQNFSESDNPVEWIIGNLGKFTQLTLEKPIIGPDPFVNAISGISSYVVGKINNFIDSQKDKSYEADVAKQLQENYEEFYSYSPEAREAAFNKWKDKNDIRESDTLNKINPKEKSNASQEEQESIDKYHQLISPEVELQLLMQRIENRIAENTIYTNSMWKRDAFHKYLENLNEAQRNNYIGRIARTQEILSLVNDYEQYLNNNDTISKANELMYRIRNGMTYRPEELELFDIDSKLPIGQVITSLRQVIEQSKYDNSIRNESVRKLMSFAPNNVVDKIDTKLGVTVGELLNKGFNKLIGLDYSAPLFNDADYIRYFLQGLDPNGDSLENKNILNNFKKVAASKIEEWTKGAEVNDNDIKKLREEYQVSDYFNWMEQHVKGSLFNPLVWAYQLPGFLGSSQSSWVKQLPSTSINLATMLFSGGASSALSMAARGAAGIQSMGLGHSSGADENYAELAENYKSRLTTLLKDEKLYESFIKLGTRDLKKSGIDVDEKDPMRDIVLSLLNGTWHPSGDNAQKMRMLAAKATSGLNSLFELDMRATTLDDFVNTTLMLTPFEGVTREAKKLDQIIDITGDVSVPTQLALKGIRKGGQALSENYGWARTFSKHFDDLGAFVQSVPRNITRKIAPNPVKKIGNKIKNIYAGNVLSEGNQLTYRALRHNIGQVAKRTVESGFAEGIEEGKQYLHGKEYQEGQFDLDDRRQWFNIDTFVKDASDGFKSATVALGVPFGIVLTSDAEWAENIKGGIMGALFQTGGSLVLNSAKSTITQALMNNFVYKTSLMEKAADMDAYRKGVLYAMRAKDNPMLQLELMRAFDTYAAINESRKQAGKSSIDSELIKEQKEVAQNVIGIANSSLMKRAAKNANIDENSEQYYQLVSIASLFGQKAYDASKKLEESALDILAELDKMQTPYRIDETLGVVNSLKLNELFGFTDAKVNHELKNGVEETDELTLARVNENWKANMSYFAQIAALQRILNTVLEAEKTSAYYGQTRKSNDFLKRRLNQMIDDKLDRIYDKEQSPHDNKQRRERILRHVESYTSLLNNKEDLINAYRRQAFAALDRDYNSAMVNMIFGNHIDVSEDLANSFKIHSPKDIIKAIEKATEKDYLLYDEIEKDYLDNFLSVTGQKLTENREKNGVVIEPDEIPFSRVLKQSIKNRKNLSDDDVVERVKSIAEKNKDLKSGNAEGFFKSLRNIGITMSKSLRKEIEKQFHLYSRGIASIDDVLDTMFDKTAVQKQQNESATDVDTSNNGNLPEPDTKKRTEEQQKAIDELDKKWAEDENVVRISTDDQGNKVSKRSGHDYFLNIGGEEILYSRVHSANDPQYIPTEEVREEIKNKRNLLRDLWTSGKKEEFKNKLKEYVDNWNKKYSKQEPINIDYYLEYLEKHPNDVGLIIDSISELSSNKPAGVGVIVGNIIHDFAARFFNGSNKPLTYSEFSKYMSEDVYNSLVDQFTALKQKYDSLGWYVDARPHVFYKQFVDQRTGKLIRVAGETDAIAIDQNGTRHIIDFKTSFKSFTPFLIMTPGGMETVDVFKSIPDDSKTGEKALMSTYEHYSQLLTMYSQMIGNVDSIEIVPIMIGYTFNDGNLEHINKITIQNEGRMSLEFSNNVRNRFVSQEDFDNLKKVWETNKTILNKIQGLLYQLVNTVDEESGRDAMSLIKQIDVLKDILLTSTNQIIDAIRKVAEISQQYYVIKNTATRKEIVNRTNEQEIIDEINKEYRLMQLIGVTWDDILEDQLSPEVKRIDDAVALFNDTFKQAYDLGSDIYNGKYNISPSNVFNVNNVDPLVITNFARLISILRQAVADVLYSETIVENGQQELILIPISDKVRHEDIVNANKLLVWANYVLNVTGAEYNVEVTKVNEKWKLLTTTWKASIESSHAVDDDTKMLRDVSGNHDFITTAEFAYVRPTKSGPICVQITYKGVTYTPVEIHNAETLEGKEWFKLIVKAILNSNGNPVRPDKVKRSYGEYQTGDRKSLLESGLISSDDLYDLKYGGQDRRIGVIKKYAGQTVAVVPSSNGGQSVLYPFSNSRKTNPNDGQLCLMIAPTQDEVPINSRLKLPVLLTGSALTDGDVDLIIDILTGKHNLQALYGRLALDQEFIEKGVFKGLTNRQVLNLLIPTELFGQKANPIVHIDFSDRYPYMVHIKGRVVDDPRKTNAQGAPIIPDRQWDLRDPNSTVDINGTPMTFRLFLKQKVEKNISEEILKAQLGNVDTYNQLDSPIRNLATWVRTTGAHLFKDGGRLRFGNSSIVFELSDFKNPNTGDEKGMSGLAWYIKNGFIVTDFKSFGNVLLDFTGTGIQKQSDEENIKPAEPQLPKPSIAPVEKTPPVVEPTPQQPVRKKPNKTGRKSRDKIQEKPGSSNYDQAVANIARILGVYDPETGSGVQVAKMAAIPIAGGAYVVGRCYADCIKLSTLAEPGVEYHEAFHRISEILMTDEERDKIYRLYKRRNPWKKDPVEGIADLFMDFMNMPNHNYNISFGYLRKNGLLDWFKLLWTFIKVMYKLGGVGLYKAFCEIENGKYANVVADKKKVETFAKQYDDGLNFTIRGSELKSIVNEHMYRSACNSVASMILYANKINIVLNNIDELSVDKSVLTNSDLYQDYVSDDSVGADVLLEFVANWDSVLPDIVSKISSRLISVNKKTVETEEKNPKTTDDQSVTTDMLKDLASAWGAIMKNQQNDQPDDADGAKAKEDDGDARSSSIKEHLHESYEFSQFSRTTPKVKFFFSRFFDCEYDAEGEIVDRLNEIGLPYYLDGMKVFNLVLNACYDIDNDVELIDRLNSLAEDKAIFAKVRDRLKLLKEKAFDGTNVDEDALQLLTQIVNSIKTQKLNFGLVLLKRDANGRNSAEWVNTDLEYNAREFKYDWSQLFIHGSGDLITMDNDGNIVMKDGKSVMWIEYYALLLTSYSTEPYMGVPSRLGLAYAFSEIGMQEYEKYVNGDTKAKVFTLKDQETGKQRAIDVTNISDLNYCKDVFCLILALFGIQFDKECLNYMLRSKYGSSGYIAMRSMFEDTGSSKSSDRNKGSVSTFARLIRSMIDTSGKTPVLYTEKNMLAGKDADNFYTKGDNTGFVGELATYKYLYRHSQDQLSALVVGGNKFYQISERNLLSDRTMLINRAAAGGNVETIDELMRYDFNLLYPNDQASPIGSIIFKQINKSRKNSESPTMHVEFVPFPGMKTDQAGDEGLDYFEISERDDELGKIHILQIGGLMSPTMSDKKTMGYLRGVEMPGVKWGQKLEQLQIPTMRTINGELIIVASDDVLTQMVEYALCERSAIATCLEDVYGYTDENGVNVAPLAKEDLVDNYHNGKTVEDSDKKEHTIIQGARFSSLLGVYVNGEYKPFNRTFKVVKDSKGKEKSVYVSEQDNLSEADKYFFAPQKVSDTDYESSEQMRERQKKQISKLLHERLIKELLHLESIGIIKIGDKSSNRAILGSLSNVYLNDNLLQATYERLLSQYGLSENDSYNLVNGQLVKTPGISSERAQQYRSLAIASYIMDIMSKAIVSKLEFERVFAGHPAFFKWTYQNGVLVDRSVDLHKRYGGLGSTGITGNNNLPNSKSTYTCAQVADEMIQSPMIADLERLMKRGQLVQTYVDYLNNLSFGRLVSVQDEANEEMLEIIVANQQTAENATNEQIEEELRLRAPEALAIATNLYTQKINKFKKDKKNKGINVADGAAYISDEMCELLLRRAGSYDSKVAEAFKILRDPSQTQNTYKLAKAYLTVRTAVIGTQKYTAYGFRHNGRLSIPFYNKMALFPLFRCICSGKLALIYELMHKQGVDMLLTNSAVKMGGQGSVKIESDSEIPVFNTYEQNLDDLRKQFNTDPDESKILLTMGTLMTKVVFSALRPGVLYHTQDGRSLSPMQLRDDIMACLRSLSSFGKRELEQMFFDEDGKLDSKKLSKIITEELSRRGASRDVLDSFSIDKDGKFKLNPAAQSNLNWIQSIIASVVNKRMIDTNTAGNLFIQRSVWGMEGPSVVSDDILENYSRPINNGERLKMINEEGSMDCVISIDYFEKIIPNYDKLSFDEAKQWLIDNDMIDGIKTGEKEWHHVKASIVGYRIPTQAVSSIHALRIVDVLPVVRDTIILPAEFTAITGSDFDIDKLFLSGITYKVNKDGSVISEFNPSEIDYWRNTLIRDQIALLINKDENGNCYNVLQLHGPIDTDTELLTDVADELSNDEEFSERMPYDDYVLSNEVSIKNNLVTGKIGIGPFALNNNNHILTMLYGVEFDLKPSHLLARNGLTSLHNYVDRDGKSILSWLSGLINAHVDIAKDSFISNLNVNPFTYNLVNLLIRVGLGRTTFYFTRQPILKQLATITANAKGIAGSDKSMSQSAVVKLAEENYIKQLIADYLNVEAQSFKTLDDALDQLKSGLKRKGISINTVIDTLLSKDDTTLKNVAKKSPSVTNTDVAMTLENKRGHYTINNLEMQLIVYLAYNELKQTADALAKLVKYSKIDTKKQGTTLAEQQEYLTGYRDVLYGNTSRMFKNVDIMMKNSYIDTKTEESIAMYRDIMKDMLFEATRGFLDVSSIILDKIGYPDTLNIQLIKQVYNSIMFAIKSKYINAYANRNGINIRDLVSFDNTMFDRLGELKIRLVVDPKYSDLVNQNGEITNPLLASLVTAYTFNLDEDSLKEYHDTPDTYPNAKFIKLLNFLDDEQLDSDAITTAWQELLEDKARPELSNFARDLIVYALITSGDVGGVRNLFRFVPMSWKKDSSNGQSYELFMITALKHFQNNSDKMYNYIDVDDIILNNWKEYTFVPTMRYVEDKQKKLTPIYMVNIAQKGVPYYDAPSIITDLVENDGKYSTTFGFNPPPYFKIKRSNNLSDESQRSYAIYKHCGVGVRPVQVLIDGQTVVRFIRYNIYQLVDPKGNQYRKGFRILEYGRNDESSTEFFDKLASNPAFSVSGISATSFGELVEQIERLKQNPNFKKLDEIYRGDDAYRSILDVINDIERNNNILSIVIEESATFYSREDVENDIQSLYIFTDNIDRDSGSNVVDPESEYAKLFGNGGQLHYPNTTSAVIRGLNNACPISTQKYYHEGAKYDAGNWLEEDFEQFKDVIDKEIEYIKYKWSSCNYTRLVLPVNGLFNEDSISHISEHQKFAEYLESKLDELYSFIYGSENLEDFVIDQQEPENAAEGTYPVPQLSVDNNAQNNPSQYVMQSGGANGADSIWADIAEEFGIPYADRQNHWYHGEKTQFNAPRGNKLISDEDYNEGKYKVAEAAKMNWGYQYSTMKDDRLVRNWAQVKYADAVFAIGHIVGKGKRVFPNQKDDTRLAATTVVQGGTGYAVGMAILAGKPVYVFDQERGKWAANINGLWLWLDEAPTLTKNFAGIGTREINEAGKQAIRDVFEKTFGKRRPMPQQPADKSIVDNPLNLYTYSRYPEGRPNYEVSSKGDSRFSAMHARFAEGTKLLGHDIGGRTIESVYQHGVKQGDWVTDNNNKTGAPKDKTIIKGNTEDDSYTQGYLPLWREWARQNPQLIEELRRSASGKVLTDMFASTKVSQARALADILNQTANVEDRPLPKFNGISELDVRRAISLIRNKLEHAEGVVNQILYNARYRGMSEQDRQDLYEYQQIVDECTLLLDGLYDGSSEVIINEYNVPQVVLKQTTQSTEADLFDQFVRNNSTWDNPDEFSDEEMNHCKH